MAPCPGDAFRCELVTTIRGRSWRQKISPSTRSALGQVGVKRAWLSSKFGLFMTTYTYIWAHRITSASERKKTSVRRTRLATGAFGNGT
jgi:hypothetical protein